MNIHRQNNNNSNNNIINNNNKYGNRPYPFTRLSSKWIIDLNVKCKTIKFLEGNIRENLDDLEYGNAF